jgi:hypothetical protein
VYSTVAAAALAFVMTAGPGRAAVFADFTPTTSAADYKWLQSGAAGDEGSFFSIVNPASTVAQGRAVTFTYLDPALSALAFLPATFLLNGGVTTSTPATTDGTSFTQLNVDGTFSFTYSGPTKTIGSITLTHDVTNLLSGVFTGAYIRGSTGSGSANLTSTLGTLSYTSDVESFTGIVPGSQEFAFNLLSAQPGFSAVAGKSLNTFTANGGGNFSFLTTGVGRHGGVPEPATWGLMIAGFGMMGGLLRRRRAAIA